MNPYKVLIVDDDETSILLLKKILQEQYAVESAVSGEKTLERMGDFCPDLILLDVIMPGMDGIEVLRTLKKDHPDVCVIMLTASNNIDIAVQAMKLGAYDYLSKPIEQDRVRTALQNAISFYELQHEVGELREKIEYSRIFGPIKGESASLNTALEHAYTVAGNDLSVLILGESGTGKELLARAIHKGSSRNRGPFVTVNCSAITVQLADSLLFGHKKGSFSGAINDHTGYFEQADNGTIFLDEIGDMDVDIQARILRTLEDKKIRRVGEKEERQVDFRIISATNHDIQGFVAQKKFRKDLFFRLEEYTVGLPPLREREGDIPILAGYFLREFSEFYNTEHRSLGESAIKKLNSHTWPGNVRELKNVIRRAVIRSTGPVVDDIEISEIESTNTAGDPEYGLGKAEDMLTLETVEKRAVEKAYMHTDRNVTQTADILGVSRATLYKKLRKYGLK